MKFKCVDCSIRLTLPHDADFAFLCDDCSSLVCRICVDVGFDMNLCKYCLYERLAQENDIFV